MAPTILIAGATGNTGRGVVGTLSKLRETSNAISGHRILALTRSAAGAVAQSFAKLPGVEVIEKNWVNVDADWLREHHVVRAFIASPNTPAQFVEESAFHVAALDAGVKYVVRISTGEPVVRPNHKCFYARAHWAIEAMLATPEFEKLQWTSLQPGAFAPTYLASAVVLIKQYRSTGKQGTLSIIGSADAPVAIIDPYEIGACAATLLALKNPAAHNKAKYVINGPEDMSGNKLVKLVEDHIGVKVDNVLFKDTAIADHMAEMQPENKHIFLSIKYSMTSLMEGENCASETSKEVFELAPPKRTPAESLKDLLT
ncbi:NAD(P)-binding protein [Astrocystis sublimbata]|nr:NAD(P)-binding protein [Astrocystis sublimbata]